MARMLLKLVAMAVSQLTLTLSRGSSRIAALSAPHAETWEVTQIANFTIKMKMSSWTKK